MEGCRLESPGSGQNHVAGSCDTWRFQIKILRFCSLCTWHTPPVHFSWVDKLITLIWRLCSLLFM